MTRPPAGRGKAGEKEAKSARTRARILDAAATVLDQQGYAGARLSDIAALAEVRAPALYYYFPSRDALVEEVVLSGQATIIDHVVGRLSALPDDLDPVARIREAVAAHLEIVLETSDFSSAALRNASQLPGPIRERLIEGQRTYTDVWRGLVEAAADAGALAEGLNPGLARMFVLGALNFTPQWFHPERGPLEALVATMQRFVAHALTRGVPDDLRDALVAQAGAEAR